MCASANEHVLSLWADLQEKQPKTRGFNFDKN